MPGTLSGILILALPGRMLISLRVLLKSLFPLVPVEQVEEAPLAVQRMGMGRKLLVLVDADLPGEEGWRVGAEIQHNWPGQHAVMLVHDGHQCERARTAGLDALPLEGMTAATLADAFYDFLWE